MSFNDEYEQTLCQIKTVHVFKIPPRTSAEGYKAEGWLNNHLWTGRLRVVARGLDCEVRLEDPTNNKPFAVCHVNTAKDQPPAVEAVTDSSRYFVLRIEDKKTGRHAFIGIGFQERTEAFDFNVAIQDHQKFVEQQNKPAPNFEEDPKVDYSMKEGEKIKVNFKVKTKGKVVSAGATGAGANTSGGLLGGGLLPPPPVAGAKKPVSSSATGNKQFDDFSDFLSSGSSNTNKTNSSTGLDFEF